MTDLLTRPTAATVTIIYDEEIPGALTSPSPVTVHVEPTTGCTDQFVERNIGYKAARAVNRQLIELTDRIVDTTPGLPAYDVKKKRDRLTLHRGELHDSIPELWQRRHLTGGIVMVYSPTFRLTVTVQEDTNA